MLETILVTILNRVLGKYIKDLDSSNLRIGILKGSAVLTHLELREDALDTFHLPVEVTHGYVGKISMIIPWTNPYSEPYEITVHDVYLIAGPIRDRKYDPERAKASEIAAKRKRLRQIEQRTKQMEATNEEKPADEADGSDSFVDKLMAQVVKNLKISVKNIHFRYEDKVTCPDAPFAVGFTLQNLSAETTNELWQECVVDAWAKTVYKIVSLDCLSLYWNTNLETSQLFGNQHDWKELMNSSVSNKESTPSNYEFILKPLSAECHVIMDQSSDILPDVPKLLIEVLQQELSLAFSQNQFHNLMDMIESFELMAVNQMYQKYQPDAPVKKNPAAWWKYAYTAISEEKIRCWTWPRIKEHRKKYNQYKELWKMKVRGLSDDDKSSTLSRIQSLEDTLDIPSILIARKHAELEVPPSQRFKPSKKEKSNAIPWWLWLGVGSGSSTDYEQEMNEQEEADIWAKLSIEGLPIEEKEKLYKAIDYSESAGPVKYPLDYIKTRATFHLDRCTFVLCDKAKSEIAQLDTDGFEASLEHRPGSQAFRFNAKVNRFTMFGASESSQSAKPRLVSSKSFHDGKGTPLLECTLETNPLHVKADYYVAVRVEPVEAMYDAETVDKIVSFISIPENSKLQELEAAAATKLQELRMWTRAGLEYAITRHEVTYLDIDVKSPFVAIPEYGTMKRDGCVLTVDLGHLKVVSDLASRDTSVRKASEHELEEMFYDKFQVTLEDVKIMVTDKSLEWEAVHNNASSPYHLLPSTAVKAVLQKSIRSDNPELARFKVSTVLPFLHLKLSDEKYHMLMKFWDHLPLGVQQPSSLEGRETEVVSKHDWKHSSSTLSLEEASDLQAVFREAFASRLSSTEEEDVWYPAEENITSESSEEERPASRPSLAADRKKVTGQFAIEKLLITMDKTIGCTVTDVSYLSLEMRDLEAEVSVRTWDVQAQVRLGFIQVLDNHWKDIDGSTLCVLSSSSTDDWITIKYTKADPSGPDFHLKFSSVEQLIESRFSSLKLTAKQEAIASFEMFVLGLFQSGGDPAWPALPRRNLETITEEDHVDSSFNTKEEKPSRDVDCDQVNFKVLAELEQVTIVLSAMNQHVGQVDIKGLDVRIDVFNTETKVVTGLKDFGVADLREGTLYPQILSLEDTSVFDCEVTILNKSSQGVFAGQDPAALDLVVSLKLGRLRVVFLNYFVAHIQDFIQALASPETVAYAQEVTQEVVKYQVQNIQKQGTKIGLKIAVNAPEVVIPCNSKSSEKLIVELGQLKVFNSIASSASGGLMDVMHVTLSSFEVSGYSLEKRHLSEHLLEPVKLNVMVKRRLNTAASDLPLIEVDAVLELLKINLGIDDFKLLVMVLDDNLLEDEKELDAGPKADSLLKNADVQADSRPGVLDKTDAVAREEEEVANIKCNFTINKLLVSSPRVIDGTYQPYLVLDTSNMSATVSMVTWILNASAKLGAIDLLDYFNKDVNGQPVKLLSSSKEADLISLSYRRVDPKCPEFESTFCNVEQQITFVFAKLQINCPQKALMDLQERGLTLLSSIGDTSTKPSLTDQSKPDIPQQTRSGVGLKVNATLTELQVKLGVSQKDLADIKVGGLTAEFLLWEGGLLVKSRQKDLEVVDLDTHTFYPKIISVENENVFDFEFKYFNNPKLTEAEDRNHSQLTEPDGNLILNVGRVNIVFLYRFISELMQFVEPLTSPQSTQYVQATAQKAVTQQIGSINNQGTRIGLNITITAPLVVIPRHSRSVDMLLADLGHLELQNDFDILPLSEDPDGKEIAFDIMELTLQSVQLSRGVMDLSSSAVIKRHLIEPVKLEANIKRSLTPSCRDVPLLEWTATLDIVKMNLGNEDYHVLTTLVQENLREAEESVSREQQQQHVRLEEDRPLKSVVGETLSSEPGIPPDECDTAWDRMVFSFELAGASLTLYSNERPLDPFDSQSSFYDPATRFCLCEVEKSVVTILLPSDSSVQIQCSLNGCIVEDVRRGTISAFPRLVDKKMKSYANAVASLSSQEMCDVIYFQAPSGEIKVDFTLQNATIFLSFPFIWPLLEFFTAPPSEKNQLNLQITSASQTSLDAAIVSEETDAKNRDSDEKDSRNIPSPSSGRESVQVLKEPTNQEEAASPQTEKAQLHISVHGVVKEPNIVLPSDATRKDSEALIVQALVEFDYKMVNEKQTFSADVTNLQMQASKFPDIRRTSYKVLNPCALNFKYQAPASSQGGQEISLDLQPMAFEFSPGLLTTVSGVMAAITGQHKVGEGVQTIGNEIVAAPADLWETKPASSDYWYKRKATEDSKPKLVVRKSAGDKLTLKTKDVQVVLVNEIEGAHVPMLLVHSFVEAQVSDWAAQLKVEADVAVEVSYYNERLASWEPLLEPVMTNGNKSMWEMQLKLFRAEGYASSFSPKDVESCDGPPRDVTDSSPKAALLGDVTRAGFNRRFSKRSSFKRKRRLSSLQCSGRRGWSLRRNQHSDRRGTTSDDEDEFDYDGAMSTFVQSSSKAFSDPSSEFSKLDTVDAALDEVDAASQEDPAQAIYILLNSHDVMQLTVTPTALQVISELSELWTAEREKKLRTIPGPTFVIHNELGVHATVTVNPTHQIFTLEAENLTVRHRIPKQPQIQRLHSLADVAAALSLSSQANKGNNETELKRILSEPLFNRLREKLHKIQRKRACSAPVSLEAVRQRKLSSQSTASFQVGQGTAKAKTLKKGSSVDSGVGALMRPDGVGLVQVENSELLSSLPPTDDQGNPQLASVLPDGNVSDQRDSVTESHVGHAIANIGTLVGGISAPRWDTEEKAADDQGSRRDVAPEDVDFLSLTVDGYYNVSFISIERSGLFLHTVKPKASKTPEIGSSLYVVVQVEIKSGRKTVTIRSPLQLQNHLQVSVSVFVTNRGSSETSTKDKFMKLSTVKPSGVWNVPLYIAYNQELFIKPSGTNYSISSSSLSWRNYSKADPDCVLVCPPVEGTASKPDFYIKALFQTDNLNKLPSSDAPHHVIHLYPPLVVHNKLPFELHLLKQDEFEECWVIPPGDKVALVTLSLKTTSQMTFTLQGYKERDWTGYFTIKREQKMSEELLLKSQEDVQQDLILGVLTMHQSGSRDMTIYSPHWIINKTGLHVEYRVAKTKQVYSQSAVEKDPLLFNFTGNMFRKAKLRLPGHPWSSKVSLDAVGDSGKVICRSDNNKKYEFILQIEMSRTGLTKIVTLTPKYVIINNTEISLSFIESKLTSPLWFVVEPEESKPFWPNNKSSQIVLKPTMSNVISKPFHFNSSHTTVLRIPELQALTVDVHGEVEDSVTTIVVTPYTPGVGTIRIENLCDDIPIRFHQRDSGQITVLCPKQMILYTWDDPLGVRRLFWKPYTGTDAPLEALIDRDGFDKVRVEIDEGGPPVSDDRKELEDRETSCGGILCGSSNSGPDGLIQSDLDGVDGPQRNRVKKTIYWVSVMDGLQRVLMFTDNENLACLARKCCDCEVVTMEVFISLDGVGLSLVNDKPVEISYITLSSSTSVWQVEKSPGKWKTLDLQHSTWLENAWRNDSDDVVLEDREVNFHTMHMRRPYEGALRRLFEPAVWFNYSRSEHYHSLHCKTHRLQVDNQQIGTVFPVALYPSPLPSSVIRRSGFKPFIEVSVIYHQVSGEGIHHIKYAKALVQEMNIKLDKGFIISMASLFSQQKDALEEENYFEEDMRRVSVPLKETEAVKVALETQKVFLEYFHLSPLRINLSFSLASSLDEEDDHQAFTKDLLDFFIDSIGATLTDINDAELKMAYFERVSVFLTQENLVEQITKHYTMQAVRQVYVLVLGLDVLGNPYGLVHGIGEGFRDLFYEPYQGIIAGPEEFAEGVARGVKSLLGHVIGGTAGAFSRITGSVGQAVATLSFDSNFQMKRRLRMHREPHHIGQGLVMGGKSLVMGLFFGISGVVVKPVEGARSDGVEGFFKGIGKGLLGLLSHPVGGVIDMVSFTLDGVRRSAEQNGEDIAFAVRPPRFTAPNMPLKPFSAHKAKGNEILKGLELSGDVYEDHMNITNDDSTVLVLLTNRQVLSLYQSKLWLGWKVRWSCPYEQVSGFPFLTSNALIIKQELVKREESTIDLAVPVYEVQSTKHSELESLKSKIDNALRRFR